MEQLDFILTPQIEDDNTTISGKMNYYVYALIDPTTDTIFYIGKGCGGRVYDHIEEAKKTVLGAGRFDVFFGGGSEDADRGFDFNKMRRIEGGA